MQDRPAGLAETDLFVALDEGWAIRVRSAEYLPVGAGGYHWSVVDGAGTAWFVTVDDLGAGEAGRNGAFDRLDRAFRTALALHADAGLDCVVAPVPTRTGAVVRRLTDRYALSVAPMVAGTAGRFGPHRPGDRAEVVDLLARLHRATPVVAATAPRLDLVLPGWERLHGALADLDREWTGGPYAEPARKLLAGRAGYVARLLADFDRLVDRVRRTGVDWVVTHGEPHPGNLMRTPHGLRLIDWETVRIAPPERDLWMLTPAFDRLAGGAPVGDVDDLLARYTRATGRTVTADGFALWALWWELADIAVYVDELHRPHGTGADPAASLTYLAGYLES
ncbi:phosphotransferase [Micromonospora sp. CPCC 206060]|uniref:phosphotransferase family protein n=1 Tax=Micromonospora sp. CPCC 206060 TaxID=3122406 RepID=UPI002FF26439